VIRGGAFAVFLRARVSGEGARGKEMGGEGRFGAGALHFNPRRGGEEGERGSGGLTACGLRFSRIGRGRRRFGGEGADKRAPLVGERERGRWGWPAGPRPRRRKRARGDLGRKAERKREGERVLPFSFPNKIFNTFSN